MPILSSLKVLRGSTKKNKRVGRGPGSGHGKTATRGHKGKKARTHGVVQRGFEGGQMPLHRRLPKFGFTNVFRVEYSVVNLDDLNRFSKEVGPDALTAAGLAKPGMPVKILGMGKLEKAVSVTAHAFSETAKAAIEKAGGSINLVVKKSKPYVRAEKTK